MHTKQQDSKLIQNPFYCRSFFRHRNGDDMDQLNRLYKKYIENSVHNCDPGPCNCARDCGRWMIKIKEFYMTNAAKFQN